MVGLNAYFAPAVESGHLMETLRTEGLAFPAVEASASFEAPLRAGDTAVVRTTVETVGESSLLPDTIRECVVQRGDGPVDPA